MGSIDLRALGLPDKFQDFRPNQLKAVWDLVGHKGPFLMQTAPTGIGKSLIYVVGSLIKGGRSIILTSTKGLQDQLVRDFGTVGLVEVRGRSNHRCDLTRSPASFGPCRWGYKCGLKEGGCSYFDSIRRANQANLVVTNYAFWLFNDGLDPAVNLILDEAHASFDHLVDYYTSEIDLSVLKLYTEQDRERDILDKRRASDLLKTLEKRLKSEVKTILKEGGDVKSLLPLSRLCESLRILVKTLGYPHVHECVGNTLYVYPVSVPNDRLFRGSEFVLLTSATVSRGTAQLLNLTDRMIDIRSYPSPFPKANRPVYVLPGFAIDRRTTDLGDRSWAGLIDHIIRSRKDQKGIVHTVSHKRKDKYVCLTSLSKKLILSPGINQTAGAVRQFKQAEPPLVLVSPSVTTGYDFPDDECRYQIISKVPFPDTESELQEMRSRIFPDYAFHYAWQQIVQAAGRGIRSADDWCDTFIVDSHFSWLRNKYGRLAPGWFQDAIKEVSTIPRRK